MWLITLTSGGANCTQTSVPLVFHVRDKRETNRIASEALNINTNLQKDIKAVQ